jgi:hypothetical protein
VAGRKANAPAPVTQVQVSGVADAKTQRALDALASAVQQLQATRGVAATSVTGSRAGGDALVSLLEALVAQGIITDNTTA